MSFDVNWLAVLVGVIVHQSLGALWYGVLFKNTWLQAMGMTPEQVQQQEGPGAEMALGAVASLLSTIAMAVILSSFVDPSMVDGVTLGAVAGVGFVAASTFMNGMYEQKKPVLSVLFGAYYTLGLMAVGAILGAWR